jgi:glyceraldehyde 3-phosphate dehydrogenase
MPLKVGINGFGRIGRQFTRVASERDDIEIVAINDPFLSTDYAAYQLKYDTIHGRFNGNVESDEKQLIINGKGAVFFNERDPEKIKWKDCGVQYVVESTGIFKDIANCTKHINAGAKRVVISAPSKTAPMFCMGVNHKKLKKEDRVISNASCTTNCLAPVAKVLQDNWGIEEGLMTTIHAATGNQPSVDAPTKKKGAWRLGRSVFGNIIPATTGAAQAIGKVIPELNKKLNGMAFRVPTADGSVVDLTCRLKSDATMDQIVAAMKKASEGTMKGYFGVTDEQLVSTDVIGDKRSSIFDVKASMWMSPRFVKIIAWYDNEMGYSERLADLVLYAAKQDGLL